MIIVTEYKKECGFREKINVCAFKKENCNSKSCSMYDIDWDAKSILKILKTEQADLKKYLKERKKLKKNKDMDDNQKKQLMDDLKIKIYHCYKGMEFMAKALDYLSDGKYSSIKDPRLIKLIEDRLQKISDKDTNSE